MIVGITGHQDVGSEETIKWVGRVLNRFVENSSISFGISCLARGADQLYAQILLEHDVPYLAIIASQDYESTFSDPEALQLYRMLLGKAREVIVLDYDHATEQAFYDAGKTLVDTSNDVIAVWNGKRAKGLGGTADIVKYASQNGKKLLHINPIIQSVSEINPTL